ncbi:acyltransferase [bacterium]|nr:acyltransferase [bacterium]
MNNQTFDLTSHKTLNNLQLIRVVLAILIVLYHSILFLNGHYFSVVHVEKQVVPSYIADWLNSFHIYSFVFVSGYLFFYLKNEKKTYNSYRRFIINKIKRLLVPYFVVSILWAAPIDFFFYRGDFSFFFTKYILGEGPSQLWFLLMLFWIFLLFYPLSNLFMKKCLFFIPLLTYVISIVGSQYLPNVFQIWNVFKFFPFFYFGYVTRMFFEKKIKLSLFWVWIIINISLFVMYIFIESNSGITFSLIRISLMFLIHFTGVLMVWCSLQFIGSHFSCEKSRVITFLAKRSMLVYLFHQQFIFLVTYFLINRISIYIIPLVSFFVSLICSLLIASLILRFNWLRILFGEKTKPSTNSLKVE